MNTRENGFGPAWRIVEGIVMRGVMIGVGLMLPFSVAAQQSAPAGDVVDRAEVENFIRVMEGEVANAEVRTKAVSDQLLSLDSDIESRLERIVSLLTSARDSTDTTGSRIHRMKEDALKGLKAIAVFYAQQRDHRKKEMGNAYSQVAHADLAEDVARLNAQIEKRIEQSLAIAASLETHTENAVTRYENEDTNYNRETTEYRRAKRQESAGVKAKSKVADDLKASIGKLQHDIRAREMDLQYTTNPERQAQLTQDIETMRKTVETRREQLEQLVMTSTSGGNLRAVASQGAMELENMVDEMIRELKRDFAKFKSLINEYDMARAREKPLRERLEKAKVFLADMDVEKPVSGTGQTVPSPAMP
jgi:hypothetical protein